MLHVLLTGATGMLGTVLTDRWKHKFLVHATANRPVIPVPSGVASFSPLSFTSTDFPQTLKKYHPDIIVNCAAITDHVYCSEHPLQTSQINALAIEKIAQAFPEAYIIQVSTDAVFGADQIMPDENVCPNPFSVYGQTKLAGENLLLACHKNSIVLRTTIVGTGGRRQLPSLAEWIIRSLQRSTAIGLFTDAIFTPVTIWHFAELIDWCIENRPHGVLHACGPEPVSKYVFGLALAQAMSLNEQLITPSCLVNHSGAIYRRLNQSLDSRLLSSMRGYQLPTIEECVDELARRQL